ncbi:hypothetical protein GGS20DRAFT_467573 [Poronia punctata]|nr:hypothetical protein GGS20DRAFT_467573 [Poronia punctata]
METYYGIVRTPADAIKLFEACRRGLLPRVQRRLSEKERQAIRSGSVFVWCEREAGMRRWTDGKSWSASRVSGSFLTYREMEGKRATGFGSSSRRTRNGNRSSSPESLHGMDDNHSELEGYRYKRDGLVKQSFSITTHDQQHLHLISYYSVVPGEPELTQPTADPQLRHIQPIPGVYPDSNVQQAATNPPMTRAPMPPYPAYVSPEPADFPEFQQWQHPSQRWGYPPSPERGYYQPASEAEWDAQARHDAARLAVTTHGYPLASYRQASTPPITPPSPIDNRQMATLPSSQRLLQAAARAVMLDPHGASNAHNPEGSQYLSANQASYGAPRSPSATPARSPSSNHDNMSLSNILHPASNLEHGYLQSSGNRSPGSMSASTSASSSHMHHDAQVIRSLNRKFCT